MAEDITEQKEPALWANFPWQKSIIVLLSGIVTLFGLWVKQIASEKDKDAITLQKYQAENKELWEDNKSKQLKIDACNEGKVEFIKGLLNNEMALKLSKDTSATSKLIVESLIKANEQIKSKEK